jgi:hypothetical protein
VSTVVVVVVCSSRHGGQCLECIRFARNCNDETSVRCVVEVKDGNNYFLLNYMESSSLPCSLSPSSSLGGVSNSPILHGELGLVKDWQGGGGNGSEKRKKVVFMIFSLVWIWICSRYEKL